MLISELDNRFLDYEGARSQEGVRLDSTPIDNPRAVEWGGEPGKAPQGHKTARGPKFSFPNPKFKFRRLLWSLG